MKKQKCIVFDFSKGQRAEISYNCDRNGQLDLDLNIEVMSPEPIYGNKVIDFRRPDKKKGTCTKDQAPSYTA